MSNQSPLTKVWFRKFEEGDVIAIFGEIINRDGSLGSYQHVGQHSKASPRLIDDLCPALPREYSALEKELEGIGYNLEIMCCGFA